MTELNIGAHCAHPECNQLDFLPIQCERCRSIFCKVHSSMLAHSCVSDDKLAHSKFSKSDRPQESTFCQIESCHQQELVPFVCEACGGAFCVKHKQKETHRCSRLWTATDEARVEKQAGLEASSKMDRNCLQAVSHPLLKNKDSASDVKPKSERARATAAKVILMKAKMSAQPAGRGASNLPETERFILRLDLSPSLKSSTCTGPISVYFGKKWPLGKLLDYGQEKFGIKTPDQSLGLMIVEDDIQPSVDPEMGALSLSSSIEDYLRDEHIVEGCLLHIISR